MVQSLTSLANLALGHLGREPVRDTVDGKYPSLSLNAEHAIEEVISEWDWPYCRVTQSLTAANVTFDKGGWGVVYPLPSSVIKVWKVGTTGLTQSVPFEIGLSPDPTANGETYIFTNQGSAIIRYSTRRYDLGRFSPRIFSLMALRLAILCCGPIAKNDKLRVNLEQVYNRQLERVKTDYANLEPEIIDTEFTPELITARSA